MNHLFLPYPLALISKEKGFNERCFGHYSDTTNNKHLVLETVKMQGSYWTCAPLYQQIIDWLREKHNVVVSVQPRKNLFIGVREYFIRGEWRFNSTPHLPYYEALNKAIEEAFKLI